MHEGQRVDNLDLQRYSTFNDKETGGCHGRYDPFAASDRLCVRVNGRRSEPDRPVYANRRHNGFKGRFVHADRYAERRADRCGCAGGRKSRTDPVKRGDRQLQRRGHRLQAGQGPDRHTVGQYGERPDRRRVLPLRRSGSGRAQRRAVQQSGSRNPGQRLPAGSGKL